MVVEDNYDIFCLFKESNCFFSICVHVLFSYFLENIHKLKLKYSFDTYSSPPPPSYTAEQ